MRATTGPRPSLSGNDELDEPLTADERNAISGMVLCRTRSSNRLERRNVKALARATLGGERAGYRPASAAPPNEARNV